MEPQQTQELQKTPIDKSPSGFKSKFLNKKYIIGTTVVIIFGVIMFTAGVWFKSSDSEEKTSDNNAQEEDQEVQNEEAVVTPMYNLTEIEEVESVLHDNVEVTDLNEGDTQSYHKDEVLEILNTKFYNGELSIADKDAIDEVIEVLGEFDLANKDNFLIVSAKEGFIIFILDDELKISKILFREYADDIEPSPEEGTVIPTPIIQSIEIFLQDHNSEWKLAWYTVNHAESRSLKVELKAQNLKLSSCVFTHKSIKDGTQTELTETLPSLALQNLDLIDGKHYFDVKCTEDGKLYTDKAETYILDNNPRLCKDYQFTETDITVSTYEALKSGIVGKWEGCAANPWSPNYYVEIEFKENGTYTGTSEEVLDGGTAPLFYYGPDNNVFRNYELVNFNQNKTGEGKLYLSTEETETPSDLKNVKLMGDKLKLEYYRNGYGPVILKLKKVQ